MLVLGLVAYQFSTSGYLTASSGGWINIANTKSEITKTYSASSNSTYYFYVKDAAGNINKKAVIISKIDKTKPTITTPSASGITDGSLTINTTFNDANSGLSKIVVYYKTSSTSSYTSKTITYTTMNGGTAGATGNQSKSITLSNLASGTTYNVYVVGYDVAGNSVQSSTITTKTKKYVAQIGSTKYETLSAAINAVGTTATTILMLDNTQESVTIPSTKSITLNLSGKTVTGNMTNQGKLTLTGGGKITSTVNKTIINEGTLNIENATIEATGNGISGRRVIFNSEKGTMNMNSGSILMKSGDGHAIDNSGIFNFRGGTISLEPETDSTSTALYISSGTVNMSGGTVQSKSFGLVCDAGKLNGTGGTIKCLPNGRIALIVRNTASAELNSMKVIMETSGTAVMNQTGKGTNCIIRSRDTNYGVTGNIEGYVIATTNTGPGKTQEDVTIFNPGTSQVYFPNWTEKNGQDDISWTLINTSSSKATITIKAKTKDEGGYNVHVYQANNGATGTFLGKLVLNFYDELVSEITYDVKFENITSTSYDVVIYNLNCLYGVEIVQVPTWSNNNGQDDIKWLTAEKQSDGTYKAHVDRSEYKDSGTFTSHVYVYDTLGNVKSKNVGTVELSGWGQWHSSTWQTLWSNGCYEIRVLWSYRQDAKANQTQIKLEQLQCVSITAYDSYYNNYGTASAGIAAIGDINNSTSSSFNITVNPNSSFTWDNTDIITTITHNSDGSWPNPRGQFMWKANIGSGTTPEIGWTDFYLSVPKITK